jgi:hypothetical protein
VRILSHQVLPVAEENRVTLALHPGSLVCTTRVWMRCNGMLASELRHDTVWCVSPKSDDPPVPVLRGRPQIMYTVEALLKAVTLVPSPSNGICFCKVNPPVVTLRCVGLLSSHDSCNRARWQLPVALTLLML